MKYFIGFVIGFGIMGALWTYCFLPMEIKRRAKDLDLMKYDGKTDKFIPKDCVVVRSTEINYLIKGTTKND